MNINPGTERSIQTLAEHLPKLERTLADVARELKRYNDRIMVRKQNRALAKAFDFTEAPRDPE